MYIYIYISLSLSIYIYIYIYTWLGASARTPGCDEPHSGTRATRLRRAQGIARNRTEAPYNNDNDNTNNHDNEHNNNYVPCYYEGLLFYALLLLLYSYT